jgi:diadenosine tetraphosphate (Ap4A) HIT family hydrolase
MRVLEPKRARYRKRTGTYKTCQFCSEKVIRDQGINKLDTEYWRVLACKYPYMDGNLILTPKRHVEDTLDLTVEEWSDFPTALKKSQKALGKLFKTSSFNIGLNIGPASGSSIKHLHWMILPRPKNIHYGAFDTFNDIFVISMDYKTLVKKLKTILK